MTLTPLMNKISNQLKIWREVSRQRNELAKLSDHLLKDIGLSRVDVEREAARPFWDNAPANDVSLRPRGNEDSSRRSARCKVKCCTQH